MPILSPGPSSLPALPAINIDAPAVLPPANITGLSPACLPIVFILTVLLVWTMPTSRAAPPPQPEPAPNAPRPATQPAQAPFVDRSDARMAYRLVQKWAEDGRVDPNKPVAPLWVSDVAGVRVTLRWLGLTMGHGEIAVHANGAPPAATPATAPASLTSNPVDLAELTRRATEAALADVATQLQIRATPGSTPLTLAQLGPNLLVDLQIARTPVPIVLGADAPRFSVFSRFAPDYHGLIMYIPAADGKFRQAWTWPATALAINLPPRSQIIQMLKELGLDTTNLDKAIDSVARLAASGSGPALARFEVIHLVQPARDMTVKELYRGQELVPADAISDTTLEVFADRLASMLARRIRAEDGRMAGTYQPATDDFVPLDAPFDEQAIAAYALSRRVAALSIADADSKPAAALRAKCTSAIDYLTTQIAAPDAKPDTSTLALLVLTITDSPFLSAYKSKRDNYAGYLINNVNRNGSIRATLDPNAPALGPRAHALTLLALAAAYDAARDPKALDALRLAQDRLWSSRKGLELAQALPWLALAELRIRRIETPADKDRATLLDSHRKELADLAAKIWSFQIGAADNPVPKDLLGGFDLARDGDSSGRAMLDADSNSAYLLAGLLPILRDQPPADSPAKLQALANAGLAARFVLQLSFVESGCFFVRNPADTLGGVRISPYDNRLPASTAAAALLAVIELQQTTATIKP